MQKFPSYINVLERGYSERRINDLRTTEFERGPQRRSPINCKAMYEITFNVSICKDDYLKFLKWYDNDICHGSNWFLWLDPCLGTYRTVRFKSDDLQFSKDYSVFNATFTVESWGRPYD